MSLWPNTLFDWVFYCVTTGLHPKSVNTGSLYIQNSIRLTVTVYSPPRELTVVFRFIHFGWKLVEISLLEGRHDRAKISIFIVVLARVPPVLASQGRVFRGFSP